LAPSGFLLPAAAKNPSVGASSALGTAGLIGGTEKKSRSACWSLGKYWVQNAPTRYIAASLLTIGCTACWESQEVWFGWKYGIRRLYWSRTSVICLSSNECFPASSSRW
jgi:hypothetical protein